MGGAWFIEDSPGGGPGHWGLWRPEERPWAPALRHRTPLITCLQCKRGRVGVPDSKAMPWTAQHRNGIDTAPHGRGEAPRYWHSASALCWGDRGANQGGGWGGGGQSHTVRGWGRMLEVRALLRPPSRRPPSRPAWHLRLRNGVPQTPGHAGGGGGHKAAPGTGPLCSPPGWPGGDRDPRSTKSENGIRGMSVTRGSGKTIGGLRFTGKKIRHL